MIRIYSSEMDTKHYIWIVTGRGHLRWTWSRSITNVYWTCVAWRRSAARCVVTFFVHQYTGRWKWIAKITILLKIEQIEFGYSVIVLIQIFASAKVLPSKEACYVSYDGEEILKENFDVLCHGNMAWVHCMPVTRSVPPFAVTAGLTAAGEPLYVGM